MFGTLLWCQMYFMSFLQLGQRAEHVRCPVVARLAQRNLKDSSF
jgi:hypothetical protein